MRTETKEAKRDPTRAMRQPIHRLKSHRCHRVADQSSIFLYIRLMYTSDLSKPRIVATPVRAEPNCSNTGDFDVLSSRLIGRAALRYRVAK